jgi:adenosylmethionine-8-amino-7-oxononanoate aminotransferase
LFGGLHEPAIESEKLMEILPKKPTKIFFSDNGSTAVEVAIKVTSIKGKRKRHNCFRKCFHGDTLSNGS